MNLKLLKIATYSIFLRIEMIMNTVKLERLMSVAEAYDVTL